MCARSERFELPTLGIEIRCSIQLSYERLRWLVSDLVWECQQRDLVARMPATVLADIGRGALAAEDGGGTVIVGEGAGLQAGPVIVEVADRVGQAPMVVVVRGGGAGYGGRLPGSGARAAAVRRAAATKNFALVISILRKVPLKQ